MMDIAALATEHRAFDNPKVKKYLDDSTLEEVMADLGEPEVMEDFARPHGFWKQGDDRPALADEDPAVMCAIGRCASSRLRWSMPTDDFAHQPCDWCEYPQHHLIVALDWAIWHSQYLTAQLLIWRQSPGSRVAYIRQGAQSGFRNPRWRDFAALSKKEQAHAVERVLRRR